MEYGESCKLCNRIPPKLVRLNDDGDKKVRVIVHKVLMVAMQKALDYQSMYPVEAYNTKLTSALFRKGVYEVTLYRDYYD